MTCLLFVYGLLQPGFRPPRSMTKHWPDAVRGRLFDLGRYPAAIEIDTAESWIEGSVVEIDGSELIALDRFEDVAGGLYRRLRTTTRSGFEVWIYEYGQFIPADAQELTRWPR